jgi:carboxypeptidase Q
MNKPYPITSLFLLTLLAGGCASAHHAESGAPDATATSKSAQASTAPSAPATAAHGSGSTAPGAGSSKYTAIIDGNEVPCPDIPMGDDATIQRILDEGKNRCQVMDHMRYLTSEIGPRLTGSSNAYKANQWCMAQYEKWGLTNAHLEQWGTVGAGFDRGPSTGKLFLKREDRGGPGGRRRPGGGPGGRTASEVPGAAIRPEDANKPAAAPDTKPADGQAAAPEAKQDEPKFVYDSLRDFQFTTMSWTAGTNGAVRGLIIKEPKTQEDFDKVKDNLQGAWVLLSPVTPNGQRGFGGQMQTWYNLRAGARKKAAGAGADPAPAAADKPADAKADAPKTDSDTADASKPLTVQEQIALQPVAGYISASRNDLVITGGAPRWRDIDADNVPQDVHVMVTRPDYDAMNSRLADGEEVYAEFDLHHSFIKGPVPVYNTVAEIRGSKFPDEVVIVSGHLDSWDGPGSQGANDNGTGTVVTLEAARILMAAHAKPDRTIRFIDWTGEEQGLLGSRAYVKAHSSEMEKISGCFVDDGGTNSEGGLTVADQMVEMLAAATAPTNNQFYDEVDKRYLNVNIKHGGEKIRTHGASDHASFNGVHVPGFFWDEVGRADYDHVHHTQFDKADQSIENYLKQSATNAAITAYRIACAPTLLPREVVPPPEEKKDDKQANAGQ